MSEALVAHAPQISMDCNCIMSDCDCDLGSRQSPTGLCAQGVASVRSDPIRSDPFRSVPSVPTRCGRVPVRRSHVPTAVPKGSTPTRARCQPGGGYRNSYLYIRCSCRPSVVAGEVDLRRRSKSSSPATHLVELCVLDVFAFRSV